MTGSDDALNQHADEEFLRKAVEELGGPTAWDDGVVDFYKAANRLWDEYDVLVERYPDKWVAMGQDGVLAVCDSLKEAHSAAELTRYHGSQCVIEFLNSDPAPLVL